LSRERSPASAPKKTMPDGGRTYLFLQGPISPFFARLADRLEALEPGARALRINLCFGDRLIWRRGGGTDYRGSLAGWPAFIAEFMDREGVTDLLLLGEQRDYHRIAVAAAQARGVQVVATDFGYLRPDWIAFELDGLTGASRFPRDPAAIRQLAAMSPEPELEPPVFRDSFWRMVFLDVCYNLSTSFMRPFFLRYKTHQTEHPLLTYAGTGLRMLLQRWRAPHAARVIEEAEERAGQTFLLPLQIARDFSIRAYSDFDSLDEIIETVVRSFARNAAADAHLVLKVHPLDPGLRSWRRIAFRVAAREGVADRIHYIDGGDLARLIDASAGVVVVNSTVGLLALQRGVATKALGQAIYDAPGLTAKGSLDEFWRSPSSPQPDLVEAALRALAGAHMVRGVFYSDPGLQAAVEGAAARLLERTVNLPRQAAE